MFLLGKAKERMEKEERGGQEAENERAMGTGREKGMLV